MAWKEFSQLSKEDQNYELERQRMIVAQSSLKRAVDISIAQGVEKTDFGGIADLAKSFSDWVYAYACDNLSTSPEVQTPPKETSKEDNTQEVMAVMTPEQLSYVKNISQISGKDIEEVKTFIWNKYKAWPTKASSVQRIVYEMKG